MKYKTVPPGKKYCPHCDMVLPVDEFYTAHGKPCGYCKDCDKTIRRNKRKGIREQKERDLRDTGVKILYKV